MFCSRDRDTGGVQLYWINKGLFIFLLCMRDWQYLPIWAALIHSFCWYQTFRTQRRMYLYYFLAYKYCRWFLWVYYCRLCWDACCDWLFLWVATAKIVPKLIRSGRVFKNSTLLEFSSPFLCCLVTLCLFLFIFSSIILSNLVLSWVLSRLSPANHSDR